MGRNRLSGRENAMSKHNPEAPEADASDATASDAQRDASATEPPTPDDRDAAPDDVDRDPPTPTEKRVLRGRIRQHRFDGLMLFVFCSALGYGIWYVSGGEGPFEFVWPSLTGLGFVVGVGFAWWKNRPLHVGRREGVVVQSAAPVAAKLYNDRDGYALDLGGTLYYADYELWEKVAEGEYLTVRGIPDRRLVLELRRDGEVVHQTTR
jgi:hypothetical protein